MANNFHSSKSNQQIIATSSVFTCHGRFGDKLCSAAQTFLAQLALPYDESSPDGSKAALAPAKEKNKGGRPRNNAASIIYAAALRDALLIKAAC